MKKFYIFTLLMLSTIIVAYANEQQVLLEYHRTGNPDNNTGIDRAPINVFIDVTYNSELRLISIIGDKSIEVEIFLYNKTGTIENYSNSLDVTFYNITQGPHVIIIHGSGWSAEGQVEI